MTNLFSKIIKYTPKFNLTSVDTNFERFDDVTCGLSYSAYKHNPNIHLLINRLLIDSDISKCLAKLDMYDNYTFIHSLDTAIISSLICENMKISEHEKYMTAKGAILHDIGKIFIPKSILNKNKALTSEEYEIIRSHPILGFKLLKEINIKEEIIKDIVLYHHESIDGNGYPVGKTDFLLSQYVKIVTVSDVFSAMTSKRSYKDKISVDATKKHLIQNSGIKYDSSAVNSLINMF